MSRPKGYKLSEQHKRNISLALIGKKLSKAHRKKLSEAHKGIQVGDKNPAWKGGKWKDEMGYVKDSLNGGRREHRVIMEKQLGRPLKRKEVVHHCNENRSDNRKENLQYFRHNTAHLHLHWFAKRHGLAVESLKFSQPWLD